MFEAVQCVHFIGIGGIGMSALAQWFLVQGKTVSGSELHASNITHYLEKQGIKVAITQHADHVTQDVDLVVYSAAVQPQNPERERADALGIRSLSYPQCLGELSKQYSTIAVSGTNGKSTTTAMLGLILEKAGYDPTVIVGSLVQSFAKGNLRLGGGRFFVVEACEYRSHFLELSPEMIVLTNIEADHLDYFKDIDHIRSVFQTYVAKLKGKGLAVLNNQDPQSNLLAVDNRVSYGFTDTVPKNTLGVFYRGFARTIGSGTQSFTVERTDQGHTEALGQITLQIPGLFNVANALAAISSAMELGVPFETCQRVLAHFQGIWRRFERVGTFQGTPVISDYGHHPTAIAGTIKATREFFPTKRITLCFQPHQHSRTLELFDDFVTALATADFVIIPEIYRVTGRTEKEEQLVSSQRLVDAIKQQHPTLQVLYANDLADADTLLKQHLTPNDILICQGAGDIDDLARKLVK